MVSKVIESSAIAELPFKPSAARRRSSAAELSKCFARKFVMNTHLLLLLPPAILRDLLIVERRDRARSKAYRISRQNQSTRFMQILPYTYSNPKTEFLGLFMFKCLSDHFGVIQLFAYLVETHLFCTLSFHANPTVLIQ